MQLINTPVCDTTPYFLNEWARVGSTENVFRLYNVHGAIYTWHTVFLPSVLEV